ncbi:hypothetical protein GHK53_22945 [Sinorhizobium meliloti]|uniref:Uncharacterized protein n=2 Tax=Rhizobium meliloti TaxID=382 RepID=A0AAW9TSS1_RHIML|nr:hypothetical protein [Sinorhizobium meliloti]
MADLQITSAVPGAIPAVPGSIHSRPFQFIDSLKIFNALVLRSKMKICDICPEFGAADQFLSSNFVPAVPDFSEAATVALLNTKPGGE